MAEPIDWELVYTQELSRVYNFFLYKSGDRETAQDLTALTFERAWRLRRRYRQDLSAIPTWLFGISRNVFKEHLRREKNAKQAEFSEEAGGYFDSEPEIEDDIEKNQAKETLRKLLLELPDREAELIALKYGAELNNREIAKITGLSESNVGTLLHRTVKGLRERMEI